MNTQKINKMNTHELLNNLETQLELVREIYASVDSEQPALKGGWGGRVITLEEVIKLIKEKVI